MNAAEWVDTVVQMRAYWLVRTLAGISMDVGMTLLIINLMMTALNRSDKAIGFEPARRTPNDLTPAAAGELAR
jgi:cytochrome c oxidase cbb3-type subunit 1